MIKLIIFDLDGVLVDTKLIHFYALNKALEKTKSKYQITYNDHLKYYDGLPTIEKLNKLCKEKKIRKKDFLKIKKIKQAHTKKILNNEITYKKNIYELFKSLSKKYKIAIATNAVKETLNICLNKLKIRKFVNYNICNEEIKTPKPNPEIYLKIFIKFSLYPKEVLILEDSHVGREAAKSSGANLLAVKDLKDVTFSRINIKIKEIQKMNLSNRKTSWDDEKLNVLIPMAGAGQRFKDAGYIFPKPIIEINKKPMIQWVVDSLNIKAQYIFIAQKEHVKKYNLESVLKMMEPSCKIIELDKLTEGAACTTLLAKKFIDNSNPLIIANSDQFIEWNSSKTMYKFTSQKVDGAILTFKSIHPKWSYAKCDENKTVLEVAEKKVISNNATVGIYYWAKGNDYVNYAEQMIKKNIRVNNEFYVCPVFNEAIKDKKRVVIEEVDKMWGLGTPEDLNEFNLKFNFDNE